MLRVSAYCRVSTDDGDQANSFASQQQFFRKYIEGNPDWELVGIFADEGISGTGTRKRREFNRMIDLAMSGGIDLIVTKEVSRFARNTVDTLQYTRSLKRAGVCVLFLSDNINTRDPDAELRLTIMASIAQEESRKTSDRVKWGQRRRMEQGVVFGRDMLGYDVRGGRLYLNEEGAETVRLIYHKFLEEGKGACTIARELREAGVETPRHMKEWSNTVILRVLRNEKYCGDLIQKKTFTPDYLTHEKRYNRGEEDFVVLRDHHEPIISRETFERAQRELARRSSAAGQGSRHSSRCCLSGKIRCGQCGARFVSRAKKRADGSRYRVWRCHGAVLHDRPGTDAAGNRTGCPAKCQIRDEDFMQMIQMVISRLDLDRDRLVSELTGIIRPVLESDDGDGMTPEELARKAAAIEDRKERLIDLYTEGAITGDEYRRISEKYADEAARLRERQKDARQKQDASENREAVMAEIEEAVRELVSGERRDDTFYRNLVDRIVVNGREHIEISLNLFPVKWSFTLARTSGASGGKGAISEPIQVPRSSPTWRSSAPSSTS